MKLLSKKTGEILLTNILPSAFEKIAIPVATRIAGASQLGQYLFQEFPFPKGFARLSHIRALDADELIIPVDRPYIVLHVQLYNSLVCNLEGLHEQVFHEWSLNYYYTPSFYKELALQKNDYIIFEIYTLPEYFQSIYETYHFTGDFVTRIQAGRPSLLSQDNLVITPAIINKIGMVLTSDVRNRKKEIMGLLQIILTRKFLKRGQKRINLSQEKVDKIYEVRKYLLDHMDRQFTLKELALQMKMSIPQLKRGFRAVYDMSPITFATIERMRQAYILVQANEKKRSEIASLLGYELEGSFIRAFHNYYGITPYKLQQKSTKNLDFLYFSAHRKWP